MPDPAPPEREKTFAEKLAERPRARFFFVFFILGFAVTPAALAIILFHRFKNAAGETEANTGIPLEAILAAVLIAAHFLSAFFAWSFWREEGPKKPPPDDQ
jgi:hypothetical protein